MAKGEQDHTHQDSSYIIPELSVGDIGWLKTLASQYKDNPELSTDFFSSLRCWDITMLCGQVFKGFAETLFIDFRILYYQRIEKKCGFTHLEMVR